MLTGATAGIAAVMFLARTTSGSSTHGLLYELDAIAAVVVGGTLLVGGRGTIVGTVLGVLLFATLTNVFVQNDVSSSVQQVAKGAIIVVAVMIASVLRAKYGHRRGEGESGRSLDETEKLRLREEVKELKERLKVLERITVEKENSLAREIDQLRDR